MAKDDKIKISVLADGTIKLETDKVSMPNHASAEQFVRETARLAGGTTNVKGKHKHGHTSHTHDHGEEEHDHEHH